MSSKRSKDILIRKGNGMKRIVTGSTGCSSAVCSTTPTTREFVRRITFRMPRVLFPLILLFSSVLAVSQAHISSPVNHATLGNDPITVSWSACCTATAYWVDVGNVRGGDQYFQSGNLGNVATTTVTGVPTDGSTVWMRLWSLINGTWESADNSYTALGGASNKGVITSPVPSTTFTSNNVTFTWTAGSGATAYWVDVGSTPGGDQYWQSGNLGNVLTTTVNNLPINTNSTSLPIYVTLYSSVDGLWFYNQYTYTAYTTVGGTAVMTYPTSSFLNNTSITFTWSAGSESTAYWLDVGSTQGGHDYYSSGNLYGSTSATVSGLPTNGSNVYATLYSLILGQWFGTQYTYIAYNIAGHLAVMSTPVPSSTLTSSSVTFTWAAGSGASAYWLDVGSIAGGHQYYSSGSLGTALTTTVSGLPTDGSAIYATLYSSLVSQWFSNSYTYRAYYPLALYPGGQLSPVRQINAFNIPLNSTGAYTPSQWSDIQTVLQSSVITGVAALVPAAKNSNTTNLVYLDHGTADGGGNYCPNVIFNSPTGGSVPSTSKSLDDLVNTAAYYNKFINLIVEPAGYGNNDVSPGSAYTGSGSDSGIFGQHWADYLDTDCTGNRNPVLSRANLNSTRINVGDYIYDSGTASYWQMQTGCGNWNTTPVSYTVSGNTVTLTLSSISGVASGQYATISTTVPSINGVLLPITLGSGSTIQYTTAAPTGSGSVSGDVTGDATCITNSSPPTFGGTSVTDGAVTWTNVGSHAPLQDVWVGGAYSGKANQFYSIPLNTTAAQYCSTGPAPSGSCLVTLQNYYIGTAGVDTVTVGGTGVNSALSCTNCLITAIGTASPTITYNKSGTFSGTSGGTASAQRHVNMGSTNATLAVLQTGMPSVTELPFKIWNENVCSQVYSHYSGNPSVGYIRCGFATGGEANSLGCVATGQHHPWCSQAVFVAAYKQFMDTASKEAASADIACSGNMNAFDLPEAQINFNDSCANGTNGNQVNDVVTIQAGHAYTVNSVQGDWPLNFSLYCNSLQPNGYYPICELQTGSVTNSGQGTSTPGQNTAGNTGSLAPDPPPGGNSGCVACPFPGLLPIAQQYLANDYELYDAIDALLAVDPNYPAGGSITSGTVNTSATGSTVVPATGSNVNFNTLAPNMLANINGTVYTITAATGSSLTVSPSPGTHTGVSFSAYASMAIYQIPYSDAFAAFLNPVNPVGSLRMGSFTVGRNCGPPPLACSGMDRAMMQTEKRSFGGMTE
jgi:hypothetical protein